MDCFIGLGTNLGDLGANLRSGLDGLRRRDLEPLEVSSVWETEPIDSPAPLWFWNMVTMVRSDLQPLELLENLLAIELERFSLIPRETQGSQDLRVVLRAAPIEGQPLRGLDRRRVEGVDLSCPVLQGEHEKRLGHTAQVVAAGLRVSEDHGDA